MHEHSSSRGRRASIAGTGTLALSLGLCLCAGQLVAPSAASAVPATPAAVTAAAKVTPRLGVSPSARSVPWGQAVRVTANVKDPRTGKGAARGTVQLQGWINKRWSTYQKKAIRNGTVNLYAKPSSTVVLRTVFSGPGFNTVTTKFAVKVRPSGAKVLAEAKRHRGALYKFGASGPKRFDCSGYTMYVYRKTTGAKLPHKANGQQRYGKAISKNRKQIGDLIVFRNGSYGYHAGIYAGNGYIYDSPRSGKRVGLHKMWSQNYVVRRLAA